MSKSIYTHKHHIIPRHAGGSDDPSNIVELTIPEHALAHKKLFEEHGRWQDEVAYLALSGSIGKEEIMRKVMSEAKKGNTNGLGHIHTAEERRKISEAMKGKKRKPFTDETRRRMSEARKGRKDTEETRRKKSLVKKGNQYAKKKGTVV